jgi:DnaA-homolog protein|tara:strand:+ start:3656 stop:4351 length:696 start_codon:yes stop_codon:yes gene_type:complete
MKETKLNKDQIPINFSFIADKSFDNFVIGKNSIAVELLKDLTISNRTNIVFIRGNHSSGKTHLCLAVNNSTNKSIFVLNRENILSANVQDILKNDSLIIDDIDFLITNPTHEENIFVLLNEFILMNKTIIITSTEKLNNINFTIPDLVSRLKWDQIIEIPELNDDDKIKVLQKNAHERGWNLTPKVCDYIMNHYKRDLYFLCNCIKFIDETSLSLKKKITIPFIKKIIEYR